MIKILSRIIDLVTVIITIGLVVIIFSQSVFAESVFQNDNEVNNVAHHSPSIAEASDAAAPASDAVAPFKLVPKEESEKSTSKKNNIDKWELNKMCLGKFCMDDPIAKHGGFKAFKLINPEIKPKLIGCNKSSISLTFPKPSMGHTIIEVTPSHEYQKKGIDNYYRITSIYTYYPEISQENIKILTDKIVARAESNYHNNEWVNPNSPGIKVYLNVTNTFASLYLDEKLSLEEYNLLQKRIGCDNEAPDL